MKEIYTDFANYNLWANQKMVDFFLKQPFELLDRPIVNSFPSAKLTFLHIWDAEVLWLKRLKGEPTTSFPSKNFEGSPKEALGLVISNSTDFRNFLSNQTDNFFEKMSQYRNTKGEKHNTLNRKIIHHVFNHSTYHRGQLLMMAKQFGMEDVPSTDYIFYLR